MSLPRCGSHFYIRIGVPRRLQALYGHKEVLRSLRTTSLEEAKVRALAVETELKAVFARLDQARVKQQTPLSPETVAALYQQKVLADDVTDRLKLAVSSRAPQDDEAESYALTTRLESLHDDPSQIHKLLDRVLFEQGLHVTPANRAPYAYALLKAEEEVLRRLLDRAGSFDPTRETEALGPTITELVEAYLTDRKLPDRTAHEIRSTAARFSQTIGGGLTRRARAVGRADVRRWRAAVLASDRAPSTQKKALAALSTIWKFGLQAGLVESNPFEGMTSVPSRGGTGAPTRLPYSPTQVGVLLRRRPEGTGRSTVGRSPTRLPWGQSRRGLWLEGAGCEARAGRVVLGPRTDERPALEDTRERAEDSPASRSPQSWLCGVREGASR